MVEELVKMEVLEGGLDEIKQ